jgi:diguanylate cyclase (GGDEF)-like protein
MTRVRGARRRQEAAYRHGESWFGRARLGWRWLDPDTLTVAVVAGVFVLGGGVALAIYALSPEWMGPRYQPWMSALVISLGLAGAVAPWERWSPRAKLVYPLAGILVIGLGTPSDGTGIGSGLAVLALIFMTIGFTQAPGTSTIFAGPTLLALVAARPTTPVEMGSIALALPLSVGAGEAVAQLMARHRRAERRIERLLVAVRDMARVESERSGVEQLAELAVGLVEADAAIVYVARPGRPDGFVNRARAGHPALADSLPIVIDFGSILQAPDAVLLPDARGLLKTQERLRRMSALLLPMCAGDDLVGVVVVLWGHGVKRLPQPIVQSGELLAQEGARMISRSRVTQQLARAAETDPLTDLANRRRFVRALERLEPDDALIVIDLDHFKDVNDRYGHEVGDETLRGFAARLREVARLDDTAARLGGEEFGIVLPQAGIAGGSKVLRRLRERWLETNPVTTFSAGLAVHGDGRTALETLRLADHALYRAKEDGRDRDAIGGPLSVADPVIDLTDEPVSRVLRD